MRNKTKTGILLISLFIVLLGFSVIIEKEQTNVNINLEIRAQNSTDPYIDITKNADFSLYASSGDGLELTPYLIENKYINASTNATNGARFINTDAHFILKNCTVIETDGTLAGILLDNVTNGILLNNTVKNINGVGIELIDSNTSELIDNSVQDNKNGIRLIRSFNNKIFSNVANNNVAGFEVDGDYNKIENNSANNCSFLGIYITGEYNEILNNTVEHGQSNVGTGISIYSGNYNNISGNIALDYETGYTLSASWNNTISLNIAEENREWGFSIEESSYNDISHNNINYNENGIYLEQNSDHNEISYNNIFDNDGFSILLSFSDNNAITHNDIRTLGHDCISEDRCSGNIIENNSCYTGLVIPGFQFYIILLGILALSSMLLFSLRKQKKFTIL